MTPTPAFSAIHDCWAPRVELTQEDVHRIDSVLHEVTSKYDSAENTDFQRNARIFAQELPRRLRVLVNDFRLEERPSGGFILTGYPLDGGKIGKTPAHWVRRDPPPPASAVELLLVILGSLLGDPFAFATQQDGHLVHDILPIKGHEHEQLGTGCEQTLEFHTEDAFHPYKADYMALLCLRNPQRAATTFASIDAARIDLDREGVLFERRFTIRPDESHQPRNNSAAGPGCQSSDDPLPDFSGIERMNALPDKVAVLSGDRRAPYLRIDPYFMDPPDGDEEARGALDRLVRALDNALLDVILQPGEFFFIDNAKAVHGRRPFQARHDGNDRWMKRINITADLRKSRASRPSCTSRMIL